MHAACPQMVAQGGGHIVNTASAGGLLAAGLLTSYVLTKHAVIGLSLALRTEAASRNVGVTAICPAAVDTPILDKGELGAGAWSRPFPEGAGHPEAGRPRPARPQGALDAVRADKALVVEPVQARIAWRLARLAPGFVLRSGTRFVEKQRAAAGG